jgi:hypothetical protein
MEVKSPSPRITEEEEAEEEEEKRTTWTYVGSMI